MANARLTLSAVFLPACLAAACQRPPTLSYAVSIPEGMSDHLAVTLEIRGAPRDSVTLRAFASQEVLRLSEVEASGLDGARLDLEAGFQTVTANRRSVDVPQVVIKGPLPSELRIRYLVHPGNREGDSHVGYTGRCYGFVGESFAFLTGRNLFLVPDPVEKISRIDVRFSLPEGWSAATPWKHEDGRYRPGIDGKLAGEHLVTGAIGLGRFRERTVEIGGTRYRLAFEAGIAVEQEEQTFARLEQVIRYVRDLFGRDLGPDYLAIVAPKAPTGDEIAGEGWATGQGETLAPVTANRLKIFAERLIEAYVRHAPYRTEIRRPEEFWLVDGVKNRYAWLAVASTGLIPEDAVARELASDYVTALSVHGVEMDLEKLYSASGTQRTAREVLAPFALLLLDRELKQTSKARLGFDSLVSKLFQRRKAESLWSLLPAVRPGFWEEFRTRYVKGTAVAPAASFYELVAARRDPDPPAGKAQREVTLVYTGETTGYLENCGCKTNQSGGVARRATALQRIRERDPEALVLDAGDAFLRPKSQTQLDFLSSQEQTLYLKTLDFMRYHAVAVGATELMFGLEHFREHTRGMSTPYLAANIRAGGKPIAPASIRLAARGMKAAVIGVFEPPRGQDATPLFEESTLGLQIEDPVETLCRETPALARQADLVIAMGRLTPFTIRRIAESCPEVDVILSSEFQAPARVEGHSEAELHKEDQEGFLGRTLVLYTHLTSYGLGSVKLGLDREGHIASAAFDDLWLDDKVPDHPQIRAVLNQFYDRIGRAAAAQESVPPMFADDPVRLTGRYVGGSVCAGCHESEHQQWMTTEHASAFKTLLDRHRHFQPRCVSCHVVGYGAPHGYRLGAPEQTLANVQCEVCHGPGGEHVQAPSRANIQRQVPEKICLECHNPEHSDHFVYAERLPKVRHDYFEEGMGPPATAQSTKGASSGTGR